MGIIFSSTLPLFRRAAGYSEVEEFCQYIYTKASLLQTPIHLFLDSLGGPLARKHASAKFPSSLHGGPAAFFAPFLGSPCRREPPGMEEAVRATSPFAWLLRRDADDKRRSDAKDRRIEDPAVKD
ncbi:hypothetical protein ZWY2020_012400 [Hordeum vulgare]|nr:hypothetical protein ZWY2020_012400 [Hordeum vulgare]